MMVRAGRLLLTGLVIAAMCRVAAAGHGDGWHAPGCSALPPCHGQACAKPPIQVKVVLRPPPAEPHRHCWWCCSPPPRGAVLDTVAIERVQAPFVRSEMVIQREQLRVVPVAAQERVRQAAPERAPAERKDCSVPEVRRESAACADDGALEERLLRMERSIEAMRQIMVEQKERERDELKR
jgi:hypothetical protein